MDDFDLEVRLRAVVDFAELDLPVEDLAVEDLAEVDFAISALSWVSLEAEAFAVDFRLAADFLDVDLVVDFLVDFPADWGEPSADTSAKAKLTTVAIGAVSARKETV